MDEQLEEQLEEQLDEQAAPVGAIGHRIAVARTLAGLSARHLATRAQLNVSLISQVEGGMVPASRR